MTTAHDTKERIVARGNWILPPSFHYYAMDAQLRTWTRYRDQAFRFAHWTHAEAAIVAACSPAGEYDDYLSRNYRMLPPDAP